ITNNTSAVGMIIGKVDNKDLSTAISTKDIDAMRSGKSIVESSERVSRLDQDGKALILSGKTAEEVAYTIERKLFDIGKFAVVVDVKSLSDIELNAVCAKIAAQGYIAVGVAPKGGEEIKLENISTFTENFINTL
ncbi:MAG: hypothetical protein RR141_04485, partial [Rikenellaceae bacterium]